MMAIWELFYRMPLFQIKKIFFFQNFPNSHYNGRQFFEAILLYNKIVHLRETSWAILSVR